MHSGPIIIAQLAAERDRNRKRVEEREGELHSFLFLLRDIFKNRNYTELSALSLNSALYFIVCLDCAAFATAQQRVCLVMTSLPSSLSSSLSVSTHY